MRELKMFFDGRASQSGFKFAQLVRDKYKAIYKKVDIYNNCYFEVIIIKTVGDSVIGGNIIEGGERYPSDNSFGQDGWCCNSFDKALEYYNNITYTPNEG